MRFQELLFGTASFPPGGEYRQFQHRFGLVLILVSVLVTAAFILAASSGHAVLHQAYLRGGLAYCALNAMAFILLRANPDRLRSIAVVCIASSFLLESIAFLHNIEDEMRVIWFALSIPAVYLLLGIPHGVVITVVSMAFIAFANQQLPVPYSPSAVITIIVAILYISVAFWAFTAKFISFHHDLVQANRKLAELAATDPLTTLHNARAYYAMCDQVLQQAQRTGDPYAMIFVDLDHFKRINDVHGHEAGDTVLREVAQCLRRTARGSDIVGRVGGEEFSIMLPGTDQAGALRLAEKIREEIETLWPDIGGARLPITASLGVAASRPEYETVTHVQRRADEAMYLAKRGGRNRVTCLDEMVCPPPEGGAASG